MFCFYHGRVLLVPHLYNFLQFKSCWCFYCCYYLTSQLNKSWSWMQSCLLLEQQRGSCSICLLCHSGHLYYLRNGANIFSMSWKNRKTQCSGYVWYFLIFLVEGHFNKSVILEELVWFQQLQEDSQVRIWKTQPSYIAQKQFFSVSWKWEFEVFNV